jgi:hypothetical protein
MMSYAGVRRTESTAIDRLIARAASPSDTLALVRNLSCRGVFVLHGDADDNVPVGQARRMREVLGTFHPDFTYHEQPGAGHWWGSLCVDWPPLFEFLSQRRLPSIEEVREVNFTTMSPGISARMAWTTIDAQIRSLAPSTVHLKLDPRARRISGTTENVSRLALNVAQALPQGTGPIEVVLDGQTMHGASQPSGHSPKTIWLNRKGSTWSATSDPPSPWLKGPHRSGPFKEAFRDLFVLVYGTRGSHDENEWAKARSRFDAEVFWYRGNGSVDIVADTEFLDPSRKVEFANRGVILYGHADGNAAWKALLNGCPVEVHRSRVSVGAHTLEGDDLACLFVYPRRDSERASIGVVSGTGMPGLRLTECLPYFISGVAYPDCTVFRAQRLKEGTRSPEAGGFFGVDWSVESGEFAWEK